MESLKNKGQRLLITLNEQWYYLLLQFCCLLVFLLLGIRIFKNLLEKFRQNHRINICFCVYLIKILHK